MIQLYMRKILKPSVYISLALLLFNIACGGREQQTTQSSAEQQASPATPAYQTTGSIEKLDNSLDDIISQDATIEVLAEGFSWSEGPVWVPQHQMLLFADIPPNRIYQWTEQGGLELYLEPAGYTEAEDRGGEPGANGLLLDKDNRLVLCQHGDRRIARMEAPLDEPQPSFSTLAARYEGKRFNSPNDVVMKSNGELYFTDPPYGLEQGMDDPAKEIPFQGVYRLDTDGQVHLLTKDLSRPNGIAFSPDEKTLYVANSDPDRPILMAYEVEEDGNISNGRVFFDAAELSKTDKGSPDGLKVNQNGILFATGPGGVLVIDPEGKHLGTIKTGQLTANCALNEQENMLYMTAHMYLMRVRLK